MIELSREILQRFEQYKFPASLMLGTILLAYDAEAHTARLSFQTQATFLNILGGVHGGMVAAMLDEAAGMGARLSLSPDKALPSLDFRVSFLAPAPLGVLFAVTRCLRLGQRAAFLEADLVDETDRLLARMNVTSIVISDPPARERRRDEP